MKQWLDSLPKRDQRILMVGAAALVIYIAVQLVLALYDAKNQSQTRLRAAAELNSWVSDAVGQIQQQGTNSNNQAYSLAQMAEAAAKKAGIRLSRFQPKNNQEAQVWLDDVPFDASLMFIAHLEQVYGVVIENIAINRSNKEGMVSARISFEQ